MKLRTCIFLALAVSALPAAAVATPAGDGWSGHLRYRHESVDDQAFARDASADTLRLRLGYRHGLGHGLTAGLEFEGIIDAGDRFNSTANGETSYPVVADPSGLEVNQAWLRWQGTAGGATVGRQRLLLDNQRFVGNVGWRQNEQTYDGIVADFAPRDGLVLRYAWLDRVHRVFSDRARDPIARERSLDAHLANASWQTSAGTVVAYGYWVEDEDVASASTRTLGLRWTGGRELAATKLGWTMEFANQRDYAGNPLQVDANYFLVEPSATAAGLTWKLGWEQLGGNGSTAFQTPLATLHAFNGWADKFLVTPVDGLDDRYASVSGRFGSGRLQDKLGWMLAWHDFEAAGGDTDYGREWDASLSLALSGELSVLLKFADFQSQGFARDTQKLWLQLEWALPSE